MTLTPDPAGILDLIQTKPGVRAAPVGWFFILTVVNTRTVCTSSRLSHAEKSRAPKVQAATELAFPLRSVNTFLSTSKEGILVTDSTLC